MKNKKKVEDKMPDKQCMYCKKIVSFFSPRCSCGSEQFVRVLTKEEEDNVEQV